MCHVGLVVPIEGMQGGTLPDDVGRDAGPGHGEPVTPTVPGRTPLTRVARMRDEPVAERAVRIPRDEPVLPVPTLAVGRVERVEVQDTAIAVERRSLPRRRVAVHGGAAVAEPAE